MNKQIVITGAQTKYFKTDYRAGPLSLVCVPDSATYSVEFTCTPYATVAGVDIPEASKNWAPASDDLTDATDLQTFESGSITGLKFILTSGTSLTIDLCQAEA